MSEMIYQQCAIATMTSMTSMTSMTKGDIPYGLIDEGALVIHNGVIVWVGQQTDVPHQYSHIKSENLGGRLITPALIDCHTHLVFAGSRAKEFEMRLKGASYQDIALSGGGIISTVMATRAASDEKLLSQSLKRLDCLISEGVAVIEIKSGYGLSIKEELRMLRIARKLETLRPVKVLTTWLAAHALPPEYAKRADGYIDEVVIPGLKQGVAEGLIDAVDGFCEEIAFTVEQIERVFKEAVKLNIPVKLHAEQLSNQKGALLAAKYKGLSADHLEYLSEQDVNEFSLAGSVAVLLPGAFYTLKETKLPPIESLRAHNVDIAIATDCNPGSSPISSLLTIMNMACKEFSMTPEEALVGVTRSAAKALNLSSTYGEIKPNAAAEIVVWDVAHPAELSQWIGGSFLYKRITQMARS